VKRKAIAASIFSLIFVLIFGIITQFTPRHINSVCDGKEVSQWSILGLATFGEACPGGVVSKSVGFPFESKIKKVSDPNESLTALAPVSKSEGYQIQAAQLIGNLIAFWIFGFIIFFLFSPMKRNEKYISNPNITNPKGSTYK